jgi:hypothetical protein
LAGIAEIIRRGIAVQDIAGDGGQGLFGLFGDIPMQMCQFHRIQIILRYLNEKPKTQASMELKTLTLKLTEQSREKFTKSQNNWYLHRSDCLNERSKSPATGKSYDTH